MWATLKQDELRRDLVNINLMEEVSVGRNPRRRKKMQPSHPRGSRSNKTRRNMFQRSNALGGEFGHYATHCPLRKNDKDEKHDRKVAAINIEEEEFTMTTQASQGGRWDDLEL